MHIFAILSGLGVSGFMGWFLYGKMFEDSEDFWSCLKFYFQPDLWSMLRGEYWEDVCKSFKLGCFIFLVGGSGYLIYYLLETTVV